MLLVELHGSQPPTKTCKQTGKTETAQPDISVTGCGAAALEIYSDPNYSGYTICFIGQGFANIDRLLWTAPYPLPQGSSLLQDLGFLGFTLDGVIIEMPIKKPKKRALTDEQKRENRARARRRVAIEHVNSSVKRCRILKDVCRLTRRGIRDHVIEIGCALHNFRLRLHPWLPIPQSE